MEYWHNVKDKTTEKNKNYKNYPIRELDEKFPWHIKKKSFEDKEGDTWVLDVLCTKVESHEFRKTVKATYELRARGHMSEKNLKESCFDEKRLQSFGFENWNEFSDVNVVHMEIPLEKLKISIEPFLSEFEQKLQEDFNIKKKINTIKTKIKLQNFSHFNKEAS